MRQWEIYLLAISRLYLADIAARRRCVSAAAAVAAASRLEEAPRSALHSALSRSSADSAATSAAAAAERAASALARPSLASESDAASRCCVSLSSLRASVRVCADATDSASKNGGLTGLWQADARAEHSEAT